MDITTDFGSVIVGSSPVGRTRQEKSKSFGSPHGVYPARRGSP